MQWRFMGFNIEAMKESEYWNVLKHMELDTKCWVCQEPGAELVARHTGSVSYFNVLCHEKCKLRATMTGCSFDHHPDAYPNEEFWILEPLEGGYDPRLDLP